MRKSEQGAKPVLLGKRWARRQAPRGRLFYARGRRSLLWWCLLWILFPLFVFAAEGVEAGASGHTIRVESLKDSEVRYSFEAVSTSPVAETFLPGIPEGRIEPGRLWLRWNFPDSLPAYEAGYNPQDLVLLVPFMPIDSVCVHWPLLPRGSGSQRKDCTGFDGAFGERPLAHKTYAFPMPPETDLTRSVYVEATNAGAFILPAAFLTLEELYLQTRRSSLGDGIFFGIIVAMIIYNLFIFATIRDRAYLVYTVHIFLLGMAFAAFMGISQEYLWPNFPQLNRSASVLFAFGLGFGAIYVRLFLGTREHIPKTDRALIVTAVSGFFPLFTFFFFSPAVTFALMFLTMTLYMVNVTLAAVLRIRRGDRPALYLLLTQACFVLVLVAALTTYLGLPFAPLPTTIVEGLRWSTVVGALLLSFGLADRFRRLSEERRHLIWQLELRQAEMERFTYTFSHDLKNPLLTIKTFLGMLERDLEGRRFRQAQQSLGRLHRAADKIHHILEELLEFSRLSYLAMEFVEGISLKEVAEEAAAEVDGFLREKEGRISISDDLPKVRGNDRYLYEVYLNLFENALHYSGEDPPEIEAGVRRDGKQEIFFVRDNGSGVPEMYQEKIFLIFERLHKDPKGMGIGLAFVKRILEHHGGRIWVESDGVGKGSTFCFNLHQRTRKG